MMIHLIVLKYTFRSFNVPFYHLFEFSLAIFICFKPEGDLG